MKQFFRNLIMSLGLMVAIWMALVILLFVFIAPLTGGYFFGFMREGYTPAMIFMEDVVLHYWYVYPVVIFPLLYVYDWWKGRNA